LPTHANVELRENPSIGSRGVSSGQTVVTKVMVGVRYFANARGRGIWLIDAVFGLTSEAGPLWLRLWAFTALNQRLIVILNL